MFSRDLVADHWFDRPVDGFLRDAGEQARAGRYLAEHYPGVFVDGDHAPVALVDRALGVVAAVPLLATAVRRASESVACRYGEGVPTRMRVRSVVLARFFVQAAAVRGRAR